MFASNDLDFTTVLVLCCFLFCLHSGVNLQSGEEVAVKLVSAIIGFYWDVLECWSLMQVLALYFLTFIFSSGLFSVEHCIIQIFGSAPNQPDLCYNSLLSCFKFKLLSTIFPFSSLVCQESVKTKHPQLHYESKLYMLLQGGSKFSFFF